MKCHRLLLSVLLSCIFAISTQTALAAVTGISGCTTLTHSGPYVLTKNITATAATMKPVWAGFWVGCIVIAADFVTVDMAGYVITGDGTGGKTMGISQADQNRKGDVVRSGTVTNFAIGVDFVGTGHTIEHVNASANGIGIDINGGTGHRVIGNTTNNNQGIGIFIQTCSHLLLENAATGNPAGSDIVEQVAACNNRQENLPAP
jgi:parallel beta-helix repeat protein